MATTPLSSDPSGDVPGGRELQSDLAAVAGGGNGPGCQGGYEGGAVIMGFREIWAG